MPQAEPWLAKWSLKPDGKEIETATSLVLPVRTSAGESAILKLAKAAGKDEYTAEMLAFYSGTGAVRLLRAEGNATLMEHAMGERSLKEMVFAGQDQQATIAICETVEQLRKSINVQPAGLPTLSHEFETLFAEAGKSPVLAACAASARSMLAASQPVTLHGDIHHENILDSGRGWLAIDPKGRVGPAVYDYANTFLNPIGRDELVQDPARMKRLAIWIEKATDHRVPDILQAAHAHAGLSACWTGADKEEAEYPLICARLLEGLVVNSGR